MQPLNKKEVAHLASLAAAGDAKAFAALYKFTSGAQYFNAFHILNSKSLAEDAVQETYLKAFEKISTLTDPRNFLSWLSQINYNCCIDIIKSKKRLVPSMDEDLALHLPDEAGEDTPEQNALNQDMRNVLLNSLSSLSEEQRALLLLRYYRDLKVKDIAVIMGCSEGTVKSRLHYTLKQLKRSLRFKGYSYYGILGIGPVIVSSMEYERHINDIPHASGETIKSFSGKSAAGLLAAMTALIAMNLALSPYSPQIMTDAAFDNTSPDIISYYQLEDRMELYVEDDLSGVDFSSASIELPDGVSRKPREIVPKESRICLPLPDDNGYLFTIADRDGNTAQYQFYKD